MWGCLLHTDPQERTKTTTASSDCRPRPTAPDPEERRRRRRSLFVFSGYYRGTQGLPVCVVGQAGHEKP